MNYDRSRSLSLGHAAMMLDQHVPLQNGVQQNDKLSQYIQEVEMAEGGQRAFASRELSAARLRSSPRGLRSAVRSSS